MSLIRSIRWSDKWLRKRGHYYNKAELRDILGLLESARDDLS